MKVKTQILIDSVLVKPVVFLLNFLVRLLGKFTHIDHDLSRDFKTIAVCKFKGMGSIIQSTAMLKSLRQKYPKAEIIFVSTAGNRKILEKIDIIDTIVTISDKNIWKCMFTGMKAILIMQKKRPDIYFDIEIYSDFSALFTLFTLSKNRIGFYLRSSSFKKGIYTHMMFFNTEVPISRVYLQMSSILGCHCENNDLFRFPCFPTNSQITQPYIVINPNSSDLRIERRWNEKSFVQLIKKMADSYPDYTIYLIGNNAEKEYTDKIAETINCNKIESLAGKTSIDELIDLIGNAKLMISNDTGPMHIAFAMQTPIVCLFGPCSPRQYGGISKNVYTLYKQAYCSPCVHDFINPPCRGNNVCMQLISVEEVATMVDKILCDETINSANDFINNNVVYQYDNATIGIVSRS